MFKLSIIIPVFNEANHLEKVFHFLQQTPFPIEREWIVVDDCSTDGSQEILRRLQTQYSFSLVVQSNNQGKGAAIRAGVQQATGEFILIQDADFEYDPRDIPELLQPLIENRADVVYGSRFKKNVQQVHRTYHYFVNRFLTILSNLVSGLYLTDMETCYKIFRSSLLKAMNLSSNRYGIEVELTAYVAKTSARMFELPIRYYPRNRLQGKKINWKDGIAAIFHIIRFNLFVSEKRAFKNLPIEFQSQNFS